MPASNDPNKWVGLLKWSMKYQDGTTPTSASAMSKADQKWLAQVMNECVIDTVERMTQIIRILSGEDPLVVYAESRDDSEESEQEPAPAPTEAELVQYKDTLLDELLTTIDQIDNAQTFCKIRGIPVLLKLMSLSDKVPDTTRALAIEVLAVIVQNNPLAQKMVLEAQALPVLCHLVQASSGHSLICRTKGLLALSCLIRGNDVIERLFLGPEMMGLQYILPALQEQEHVKLQRKALFFLRSLFQRSTDNAEAIMPYFPIASLVKFITHDDTDLRETSLSLLVNFAQEFKSAFDLCVEKLGHDETLAKLHGRERTIAQLSAEEVEYAQIEVELIQSLKQLLA